LSPKQKNNKKHTGIKIPIDFWNIPKPQAEATFSPLFPAQTRKNLQAPNKKSNPKQTLSLSRLRGRGSTIYIKNSMQKWNTKISQPSPRHARPNATLEPLQATGNPSSLRNA
jgi:hypothetical protein